MKIWNELTNEEKVNNVKQINETYDFTQYDASWKAAYNVRIGYENDPEWFSFVVTDLDQFEDELNELIKGYIDTFDVQFNDDTASNSKGWHESFETCLNYIKQYNGTNESYFEDYKGGTVSIVCNRDGEAVYEEEIR